MKAEQTKWKGFRIQDPGFRIVFILIIWIIFSYSLFLFSCTQAFSPTELTQAQEDKIRTIVNDVSLAELENTLVALDGIRNVVMNEENIPLYEAVITEGFSAYGLEVETQEVVVDWALYTGEDEPYYVYGPFSMNTIIAVKPGSNPGAPPVLFTAHWDTHPLSPGIDDNATGCAALLEGARVVRDYTFAHTIKFIAFAFEEEMLAGSVLYAKTMKERPKVVINLDMIGYTAEKELSYMCTDIYLDFPDTGDFTGVFAADFSSNLGLDFIRAADIFVPDLKYYLLVTDPNFSNCPPLTHLLRGDHAPFWEKGIPAILVTDTAFFRDGHPYHTEEDTIDNIDFTFLFLSVRASIATLCIESDIQ